MKNIEDFQATVRSAHEIVPRGGGTKPALSTPANGVTALDMSLLNGIIEYQPMEYTFTAYAGTPVQAIIDALAEHGQYLPFDPLLVKGGATLGGTVAANMAGSGRYRYGGVRDFILGIRFIDGRGDLISSGGKVVKNSAGFDLPKFMVGSLGRYGGLVELTFKFLPQPRAYLTLKLTYPNLDAAMQALYRLATQPFELEALDLTPTADEDVGLLIRLGGLTDVLPGRAERLQQCLQAETEMTAAETLQAEAEATLWAGLNDFAWADKAVQLIKIPLAPKQIPALEAGLRGAQRHYSVGGNIAWVSTSEAAEVEHILLDLGLVGLSLLGAPGNPYLGRRKGLALAQRVKQALDPAGKFLAA